MSLITVTPSNPQDGGVTREALLKRWLRETGLGEYGTSSEASDASTLVDTVMLKSLVYSPDMLSRAWLRIGRSPAGTGPAGNIRPISEHDVALGAFKVDPPLSASVASGDVYQVIHYPHPQYLLDFIDDILTHEMPLEDWALCTDVPDGDMELSSATADWDSSGATVTKQTAEPIMYGLRRLRVVDTGAGGGYAVSKNSIAVEPLTEYHLSAVVRSEGAATAKLLLYDVTNAAEIASITVARNQNVRLCLNGAATVQIPAGCKQVKIRLITVTASGTTEWDEVCFYPLAGREVRLPSWVKGRSQVAAVFRYHPDTVGTAQPGVLTADLRGTLERGYSVRESFGGGSLRLVTDLTHLNWPLYIYGTRYEEAYSNETTDLKSIDINWMLEELKYKVYMGARSTPAAAQLTQKTLDSVLSAAKQNRDRFRRAHFVRMEETLDTPQRWVGYSR